MDFRRTQHVIVCYVPAIRFACSCRAEGDGYNPQSEYMLVSQTVMSSVLYRVLACKIYENPHTIVEVCRKFEAMKP